MEGGKGDGVRNDLSNEICLILLLIQNKLFLGKEAEEAVIRNVITTTGMSRTQTE